ncbi:H-type lectin domain-containing protein [Aliiroseovarius sp. PTFE2010]|uniref:H-type lectin domain-containing protein n=1 Tax=Aliiroseovarius sp. PTFE2010 TaxID=3417190 RepID=UPI003CFB18C6
MIKVHSGVLGVDQGSVLLFSDFQDGGAMWTGTGPRELRHIVEFEQVFSQSPVVQVSIGMWDMDQKTNARADITAEMVNPEGFVIVFRTWADTRVARIRADWIAMGAMPDDDNWDV